MLSYPQELIPDMEILEWTTQVRKGLLKFCIMTIIRQQPRYGYEIVQLLQQSDTLAITEGTLYPLLHRLVKEQFIDSYWQESESGPPRKYYTLTDSGHIFLEEMSTEWNKISSAVSLLQQNKGEVQ